MYIKQDMLRLQSKANATVLVDKRILQYYSLHPHIWNAVYSFFDFCDIYFEYLVTHRQTHVAKE